MKLKLYLLLCLIIASCSGVKDRYIINGEISGIDNTKIYLLEYSNDEYQIIDTTNSVNGAFTFEGSLAIPARYYIVAKGVSSSISLFAENSKIDIKADGADISKAEIKGSSLQDEYQRLLSEIDTRFVNKIDSLNLIFKGAEKINDQAEMNNITNLVKSVEEQQKEFLISYFMEHNNSVISPNLLYKLRPWDFNDLAVLKSVYNNFDPSILDSPDAKVIKDWIGNLERIETGQPLLDFSMNDTIGRPISPSMFSGKYLLIDMWSSACPPCRKENPDMERLYKKYKNKGFEILGVSFDSDRDTWLSAIKHDGITWTQVSELTGWNNSVRDLYSIESLPTNFLIDRNGIIVAKNLRREKLEEKLVEIFD